jgi:hypothetical protein
MALFLFAWSAKADGYASKANNNTTTAKEKDNA